MILFITVYCNLLLICLPLFIPKDDRFIVWEKEKIIQIMSLRAHTHTQGSVVKLSSEQKTFQKEKQKFLCLVFLFRFLELNWTNSILTPPLYCVHVLLLCVFFYDIYLKYSYLITFKIVIFSNKTIFLHIILMN